MPIEPISPKYAMIANALQERIENGVYPVATMLPSEAQLVREFAASRSTVVRALEYVRQQRYIEGVQGKGRIVLGRPMPQASQPPGRVRLALHAAETNGATLVGAGRAPAPPRIAVTLAIPAGEPVIARQRLMPAAETGSLTLSTMYLPAIAADGTTFHTSEPLQEGVLDHLERRRRLVAQDVVERLSARIATTRESALLKTNPRACVLAASLVVRGRDGHPLLVLDLVIPTQPEGVEDTFNLR